jgi:formamidopyrimidine-DNA glycosylase
MVVGKEREQPTGPQPPAPRIQIAPQLHLRGKYIAQREMFGASMIITHAKMQGPQTLLAQKHQLLKFMMTAHQTKFAAMEPVC